MQWWLQWRGDCWGRRGQGWYRLHQPAALAVAVWGSESRTTADCRGVWTLDGQRSPTLGDLHGTDVTVPHWPRQVPWGQGSRRGGDLAADSGEVCVGGDGGGDQ